MMILQKIALVFTIIGAVVWGIYGLFDVNIVAKLFANVNILEKVIYEELNIFFTRVEKNFDVQGKYIHMAIDGKELRGTGRNVLTNKPLSNLQTLNVYNVSSGICLFSTLINKKTKQ